MLNFLGLAETTPEPLILVTEFVGYLAGWQHGGGLAWVMGLLGALSAITAAVTGIILNLAVWFALHVFFARVTLVEGGSWSAEDLDTPELASLDGRVVLLAALSGFLLLGWHWSIAPVQATAAAMASTPMSSGAERNLWLCCHPNPARMGIFDVAAHMCGLSSLGS